MKSTTAETIAQILGQPVDVYTDDSRTAERLAHVKEVETVEYPLDMPALKEELEESGKTYLFLTDGKFCSHLLTISGETLVEVTRTGHKETDVRIELRRIMAVYRRNCRFEENSDSLDLLKGLVLYSKGDIPESKSDAERALYRIFREDDEEMHRIGSWEPVLFALNSIRANCPDVTPEALAWVYLMVQMEDRRVLFGTDRLAIVAASFVETPSVSMYFFNPFIASALPHGTVTMTTPGENIHSDLLFCELLGVKQYLQRGFEPTETVFAFLMGGRRAIREPEVILDLLRSLPEGGRLIAVVHPSVMYRTRSSALLSDVKQEGHIRSVVRVSRGVSQHLPGDATVMVVDRGGDPSPTEYATVPDLINVEGDWRQWPGVTFKDFPDIFYDTFSPDVQSCISAPSAFNIGSVATVKKGSMVRSDDLFPAGVGTGLPYLTPKDLKDGGFDFRAMRRAPGTVSTVAKAQDILIVCYGLTGRVYRMKESDPPCVPSYAFAIISVTDRDRYSPEFLELYLRGSGFQEQVEDMEDGHRLRSVSTEALRLTPIPDIPLDRQLDAVDEYRDALDAGLKPNIDEIIAKHTEDD